MRLIGPMVTGVVVGFLGLRAGLGIPITLILSVLITIANAVSVEAEKL
jgi:hypothetical protein